MAQAINNQGTLVGLVMANNHLLAMVNSPVMEVMVASLGMVANKVVVIHPNNSNLVMEVLKEAMETSQVMVAVILLSSLVMETNHLLTIDHLNSLVMVVVAVTQIMASLDILEATECRLHHLMANLVEFHLMSTTTTVYLMYTNMKSIYKISFLLCHLSIFLRISSDLLPNKKKNNNEKFETIFLNKMFINFI